MHLAYGGMHLFSLFVMIIMFVVMGITLPFAATDNRVPPAALFAVIGLIVAVFTLILTAPPLIAGYALLKRKRWSKAAGAVSAALALLSIPMGTALGVYTFWFLFGAKGRQLYHPNEFAWQVGHMRDALHGSQPPVDWGAKKGTAAKPEYIPPKEPPDWR
jgi:membrane protease YdiL (CAAX protease family)